MEPWLHYAVPQVLLLIQRPLCSQWRLAIRGALLIASDLGPAVRSHSNPNSCVMCMSAVPIAHLQSNHILEAIVVACVCNSVSCSLPLFLLDQTASAVVQCCPGLIFCGVHTESFPEELQRFSAVALGECFQSLLYCYFCRSWGVLCSRRSELTYCSFAGPSRRT